MDLSLFFAGTGGSVPSARRGLPAVLVRRGGDRLLFDCGEGTQRQLLRSVGLADVECVFITHFHADHWLGLPGMLKSFALRDREQPLSVYGPPGLGELMAATRFIYGRRLPYELTIAELGPGEAVELEGYRVAPVPVSHKGASAVGYAIVEDARPGELDPQLAERLGVRPGPDFGRLVRGETVNGVRPEQVVGPTREGRKVVISGDTSPCETLVVAAHQADVLVHEATFVEEEAERARQTGHSTARQAAELARAAEVRLLVLTHLSTRYAGGEVREEARAVLPNTEVPRDFDTVEVPFPERGPAKLIRWSKRGCWPKGGREPEASVSPLRSQASVSRLRPNRPAPPEGAGGGGRDTENGQGEGPHETGPRGPRDTPATASSIIQ
ncbi:MAG TPA: ribonuclease Z [Solirubrobacteraceae bacterium]|jgi:ribonuclease Z|nr:ribonuclease Z [Solirubrobacteraceae bacterium]